MPDVFDFPDDFIWGAAAPGPGADGLPEASDWRIWERSGKAAASGPGNGRRDRCEEDFQRLVDLGFSHLRLGLEWARVEPQRGVYNREALDETRRLLESLKRRGIAPWLGLHHFSLPAWFARMGGFADETAIVYWHRFVELAARELGKLCDFWIPVDRPMAYALQSRLLGKIPPGQKRMDKFNEMLVAIHRAHGDAATILRKRLPPKARIGFNLDVVPAFPQDPGSEADRMAADFIDNYLHRVPLALIKDGSANIPGKGVVEVPTCQKAADFIALDYFNRLLVSKEPAPEAGCLQDLCALSGMPGLRPMGPEDPPTEAGYGAAPDALYDAIKIVHSAGFDLPIHITASGVPTSDEDLRVRYTTAALAKVAHAIKQGIDVRSYFHYRDVDAYEFGLGFKSHFGLHGFDPHSFERSPRPLAALFKKIIATQKLPLQTG